ncbi:peptidoglycan-binding domain-containing protein [Nitrospirillum pindoramense]|uniref:Putative peptidoglycan binding protein n=1 Tax=Nitrospirillum amazonense TaxID=28077 RepID=A0A560GNM5_9PROT|nr:peptidoglycan-binding domain-containing protein [Nitrospirillum amazonense]TWB35174.1 putative peptidoglycan binding protein [Nitrospirillum amazonense]
MSNARRPLFASAILAVMLTTAGAGQAWAAPADANGGEPNSATIQWAQNILKEKELYEGRATSRMDPPTIAALRQYQKAEGLKVTGKLDQDTIARMMEGRPVDKTVGNLADPTSRARASQPRLKEEDVQPRAARSAVGVERGPQGQESTVLSVSRTPTATPSATPSAPADLPPPSVTQRPGDAPAASTTGQDASSPTGAGRIAVETQSTGDTPEQAATEITAPDWARNALLGFVGALFALMAGIWWWSGRRPSRKAPKRGRSADARREPSLSGEDSRLPDGRVMPRLGDGAARPSRPPGLRVGR